MELSASIEWICEHAGIVRIHQGPNGKFGDPYVWCATIAIEDGAAILRGVATPVPGHRGAAAIRDALILAGFDRRGHTRVINGQVRTIAKET